MNQLPRGGTLQIYNTLTRTKEPFETIEPGKVRMYVCGDTVYASSHIGHGMSKIVFDMIRRYLEHKGYEVRHAQNFTDVDDKIINRANEEGITTDELVETVIADYFNEISAFNVQPATVYPRATQEIPGIITMIEGLIAKGHAYPLDGDVYYRVRSFPGYGKLSHRSIDDLRAGARIEVNENKEDPLDFAVWKAAKPGEPSWPSPWGDGRPGWHIECSEMCSRHLGGVVDIHGGGADLIFPHHENEIAQSEAFLGQEPFSRFWVHNGLLQLGDEKMSKSIGNIVKLREIIARGLAPAFRLLVLQSHYRAPLTYTEQALQAAESGLDRLRVAARPVAESGTEPDASELPGIMAETDRRFHAAMDDDFDTPKAVAALFDLARAINRETAQYGGTATAGQAQAALTDLASVLGLDLSETLSEAIGDGAPFIELLIQIRQQLRDARQWALADRIRDGLTERGITIEDTANGTTWRQA